MKNNKELFEQGKRDEEDLLDFESDELSEKVPGEASGDSLSERKIIELTDIVDDSKFSEIARLLDEEEPVEDKTAIKEDSYFALDEIGKTDESVSQGLESDLSSTLKTLDASENDDIDFKRLESDLKSELDAESLERTTFDLEDSTGVADSPLDKPKSHASSPTAEKLIGLSEERLAAIITRVVQDVVERVARETMKAVSERMIREAIGALKQSLQSPQD
ncbi:MAG: hypothetical protein GY849_14930 [Deltaproteobacteria bacterium]|nr:hypothetical protein [Deltaproteobacteria bacterium]